MDLPKSIAITGASGFIGRQLVSRLQGSAKLTLLNRSEGFDICDADSLLQVKDVDAVVHLAAKTHVPSSRTSPKQFMETNVTGTLNVMEMCRQNDAKFVYLSTYVYGKPQVLPIDENHPVVHWNPYASSKLISEEICAAYSQHFGLSGAVLRVFNVYGPDQSTNFLIPTILDGVKSGKLNLKSSKPKRDFVHVRDVVEAILCSLKRSDGFNMFNVGSGTSHSVAEIVDIVLSCLPSSSNAPASQEVEVNFDEVERPNEVFDIVADWSKINSEYAWEPTISLSEGIKELMVANE